MYISLHVQEWIFMLGAHLVEREESTCSGKKCHCAFPNTTPNMVKLVSEKGIKKVCKENLLIRFEGTVLFAYSYMILKFSLFDITGMEKL